MGFGGRGGMVSTTSVVVTVLLTAVVGCSAAKPNASTPASGTAKSGQLGALSADLTLDEAAESTLAATSTLHVARVCEGQQYATTQGTDLYGKACTMGDAESCAKLGVLYLCGSATGGVGGGGVEKNGAIAATMFEKSCALHNTDGCQLHAATLITGIPKRDTARGLRVYAKACDEGSARACGTLGAIFMLVGKPEVQMRAVSFVEKSCDLGNDDACGNLAVIELNGIGGREKNPDRALKIAKASCAKQSPFACAVLGTLHMTGTPNLPKDEAAAAKLFSFACDGNDALGCLYFGVCTAQGLGVAQNLQVASDSLKKSCDGGNGQACRFLAEMSSVPTHSPSMTSSQSGGANPTMF